MATITLLGSSHQEFGRCNPIELMKILEKLHPEVVFEERNPSIPLSTYNSVEVLALNKYSEARPFERVPVDHYDRSENILSEWHRTLSYVENASQDYRRLLQIEDKNLYHYGFAYINSDTFGKLSAKIREVQDETILRTGDQALIRGLRQWRKFCQDRESKMIANIYEYTKTNSYNNGVFIFGANHKDGVLREIGKHHNNNMGQINWIIARS